MITKNIISFLHELKENNNREWFQANKNKYETAKSDFENFVINFIPEVIKIDKDLGLLQAKDCIFRIYRDTRFSKDKTPYKTNFGAFFVKGGKSSWRHAGYYIHIEPDGCFMGGGIHIPPPDVLKIVRKEIYYNIEEFKAILENKKFKATFGPMDADKVKTAPRDFPADFPEIDLLKFKKLYGWKRNY